MAIPQFDLFAFAKGAEYGIDQNTQDEQNALTKRRDELSLDAFEKQLTEYDSIAPLRRDVAEQSLRNAQLKGQQLTSTMQDDLAYKRIQDSALATLGPELMSDMSPLGGLRRADAIQTYMQQNKVDPRYFARAVPGMQAARAAALDRVQYNPTDVNELLRHSAFGSSKYQIAEIPGQEGQYRVLQAVQVPADSNNGSEMVAYVPTNRSGNLEAVMSTLRSEFSPRVNPDYGNSVLARNDKTEFDRAGIVTRAELDARVKQAAARQGQAGITQRDVASIRTNDTRVAGQRSQDIRSLGRDASNRLMRANATIAKLRTSGGDVRDIRKLEADVKALEATLSGYKDELLATDE